MKLLGFEITRTKASAPPGTSMLPATNSGGWWPIIREPFAGAWQRNLEKKNENFLTYHAVYACVSLISTDVAKCRLRLVEQDANGIWNEVTSPAFSPVLRKPNRYQNRIKFIEQWIISKLLHGNTYVVKQRDQRGVVVALYILDPTRVKPLITTDGQVWYQLYRDNLSGIEEESLYVPASEIIHDVMSPLYHPLCGVSPLTACGIAALQGLAIQNSATKFFANGSMPGGVLTAPDHIDDETAKRLKEYWETKFSGENSGKIAVLGDGLKFERMTIRAVDAQLIEQLKWSAETVCSAFHVPSFKIFGSPPANSNVEAQEQSYYSQCLQILFECVELCLDEGLGLTEVDGKTYGTEFDLDDLLRMDTATLVEAEAKAVGAGIKAPNESRKRLNLGPKKGGNTPYLQEQNYSLEALDQRDRNDPFAKEPVAPPPAATPSPEDDTEEEVQQNSFILLMLALKAKMDNHGQNISA